ncbi:MAG: hypothetical protein M1444_02895 [Patescibacteria group bacterium]|nr:hypothetical protein [Patescibacteria group bacterium]
MKKILIILFFGLVFIFPASSAKAENGSPSGINNDAVLSQRQEEQEGKNFLDSLSAKKILCKDLKDSDFEKIGEYFMGKVLGDTQNHLNMNNMMKNMMGEKGEENMHIAMGKKLGGCFINEDFSKSMPYSMMAMMGFSAKGGVNNMMGYGANVPGGWDYANMMGWSGSGTWFWVLHLVTWIVVAVDLVLLGMWLWKQLKKK